MRYSHLKCNLFSFITNSCVPEEGMAPNRGTAISNFNVPHPCYNFIRIMYASHTAENT